MKTYRILIFLILWFNFFKAENSNTDSERISKLADYFSNFKDYCFALDADNMINGSIDFTYR